MKSTVRGPSRRHPVELAAVAQHLGEAVVVGRARHQAAAARQHLGRRQHGLAPRVERHGGALGAGAVEGGQAILVRLGHREAGVGHAQRLEDVLGQEAVERLARHHLDQPTEHVGRHRVVPLGAGLEQQRHRRPHVDRAGQVEVGRAAPLEPGVAVHGVDRVGVVEAVGEPGRVGQQVPDAHRLGGRHGHRRLRRPAAVDALVAERLDVAVQRVLQLEGALLVEHHRRHRRDRLGHRVDAPQRVALDRRRRPRGRGGRARRT